MAAADSRTTEHDPFTLVSLNTSCTERLSLECLPNWSTARNTWGYGWSIHTYGLSFLYCILCVFSCVCVLFILPKWKAYRFLIFALAMLVIIGLLRCLFFLIDPYSYTGTISPTVSRLLLQTCNPALSGAFAFTQRLILRLTRLDVGSIKLQQTSFVVTLVSLHFIITISVETIVSENHNCKPLLLFSHGYFILWTTYLSVTFVYNGFKMTHYTSETQRALKDLNAFNHYRKNFGDLGVSHLAQSSKRKRILKPRIQMTNEENKTCSIITDSTYTSESDIDDITSCSSNSNLCSTPANNSLLSSLSESGSDSSCRNSIYPTDGHTHLIRPSGRILRGFTTTSNRDASHSYLNGRTTRESLHEEGNRDTEIKQRYQVVSQLSSTNEVLPCETGYIADTESSFSYPKSISSTKEMSSKCLQGTSDPGLPLSNILPSSSSTLSLHRIRQSKMVHKLIVATYVTTFLGFIVSLLHFYAIFGSYGIFGTNPQPDPWPWLLFQTFQRLIEFGMGSSIGVSGWAVIQYRHQRSTTSRRLPDR